MDKTNLGFGLAGAVAGAVVTGIGAAFKIKSLNKAIKAREGVIRDLGDDLKAEMKNVEDYKIGLEMEEFKVSTLDEDLSDANDRLNTFASEIVNLRNENEKLKAQVNEKSTPSTESTTEPKSRKQRTKTKIKDNSVVEDEIGKAEQETSATNETLKDTVEDILKAKGNK